jgi:hypothetical protein
MAGSSTTRDDFHAYDELRGPYLDAAQWSTARLPLPTGEHVPLDPNAALVVGDGELRVTIPRFSLSHDTFQAADSPKYLVFSRAGSICRRPAPRRRRRPRGRERRRGPRGLPPGHGGVPCVRPRRKPARFRRLPHRHPRVRAPRAAGVGRWRSGRAVLLRGRIAVRGLRRRLHPCEITLDRSTSTATWRVDGRTVYEAPGTVIPERARIGVGIWTMLPIRGGRSRSLAGQGMSARWRGLRVRGVEP